MRKLWMGIIGLAAASTANAAIVTFHMRYNDDGTGVANPGFFSVYATTSQGDNGGLFAYGIDLTGAPLEFIANTGQGVTYRRNLPPNTKSAGFLTGYTQNTANGTATGVQDLSKTSPPPGPTWNDMIPIFGLGQEAGDMRSLQPPTHPTFTDVNGAGTAYGTASGIGWSNGYLLAVGAVPGFGTAGSELAVKGVLYDAASTDHKAGVWVQRGPGASTDPVLPNMSVIPLVTYEDLFGGGGGVGIAPTGTGTNVAVGGAIAVTGANNKYVSEVDQLTANLNAGNAPIETIGAEGGNIFVMAKLDGPASEVAAAAALPGSVPSTDAMFMELQRHYPFFNALFSFPNTAGAEVFNFDFAGQPGVTVDQLAAVPEPGMLSLLGIAGLGLLARRRRNA